MTTIWTINHIQCPDFPVSINNAFVLEKQYSNKVGLGYRAHAIYVAHWFRSQLFSKAEPFVLEGYCIQVQLLKVFSSLSLTQQTLLIWSLFPHTSI